MKAAATKPNPSAGGSASDGQPTADRAERGPAPQANLEAMETGRQILPCVHCGEPTECAPSQDPERLFCCQGCHGAYELIHGWGLQDFYALREQAKLSGAARQAGQSARYDQFDSSDYLGPSAPVQHDDGTCSAELAVHGLHCGACAWLIESAAGYQPGLVSAQVKMSQHTVRLVYDPGQTRLSKLAQMLDCLGYQLAPYDPARSDHIQTENRRHLINIAIAGFLAANAMWIAVALYAGEFSGVAAEHRYFLGLVGTVLGFTAVAGPGRIFFTGAIASLKTWTPHMDLPVTLGLSVGSVVGLVNAASGQGAVYFDSLATLVFLLLIGRWIQFRQQQHAARAVDLMLRLTPRHAELDRGDGSAKTVLVDSLMAGDVIRVAPGDCIAADGEIVTGQTRLDRSLLTGESIPVEAQVDDQVSAGVINLTAPIRVRVSATGRNSRIGQVMQAVESATMEKTSTVMFANRIGGYFVVAVMLLAALTFTWWIGESLSTATSHATALLIVACPCALALATPLAIAVGLARAARCGILIRDGSSLQQLSRPGHMWLDKTGTLTEGKQRVTSLAGSQEGLRLAASVESGCKHPVADAIVREARLRQLDCGSACIGQQVIHGGVLGTVEGRRVAIGNLGFIHAQNILLEDRQTQQLQSCIQRGESPVLIALDGSVTTVLGVSDPPRVGALQVTERMRRLGWKVGILSGDHPAIVQRIGRQLGFEASDCYGGLSPEEKLAMVRQSRERDPVVVMVGDGVNDAAALAAADVGVAVQGGAEVSLQAAPIFVASGSLQSLIDLLQGATRSTRLIWATFAISLGYNAVAVGLAMAGWISPLAAAVLMPISSVSVLAVTLATPTFRETAV